MAYRKAESTLTKSLLALDYGYSDLCRYVSYSKNKQSEPVFGVRAPWRARRLPRGAHAVPARSPSPRRWVRCC